MSEITEDMLDGLICQQCGMWMEDVLNSPDDKTFEVPGYPRTCRSCAGAALHRQTRRAKPHRKREGGP